MERKIYLYTNEILSLLQGNYEPPVTCEIDLTNKCQLNCSFCMYRSFRKKDRAELDSDTFKSLIHQLKSLGVKSITFTGGGEPLMHPNAIDLIDLTFKEGFDIGIITNGIALDTLPVYLKNSCKFIRISLDAASRMNYKRVKRGDYYDRVITNIREVVKTSKGKVTIGLSYVLCKENEHEFYEAEKLSRELDVDYIQFKPAWDNGSVYEGCYIEGDDSAIYVMDRYKAEDKTPCMIAGLVGIVAANGRVYFCCQHRGEIQYEIGDLNEDSFDEIWRRREYISPSISSCPRCRYMNYAKKFKEIPEMLIEHRSFL